MRYKKQSLFILAIVIIIAIVIYVFSSSGSGSSLNSKFLGSEETVFVNEKTYESEISYRIPRGNEIINVELTLNEKKIVDVTTTHSHISDHSSSYMDGFDEKYKGQVVGKNIDEVNLESVAGASITTEAFMKALQDIQEQI